MAAQPECVHCGVYVHHGLVLCENCASVLREMVSSLTDERNALQAEVNRLTGLLFERETILPNGELGAIKEDSHEAPHHP